MQCLDYPPLHQDAVPTQNHQQKKKSDHSFLYPIDRQHKNAPMSYIFCGSKYILGFPFV